MKELARQKFRVTSIPCKEGALTIFNGVPLDKNSSKISSAKFFITVITPSDSLPVEPAIGQHWFVGNDVKVKPTEVGGFIMQQHTYESPELLHCTLPDSGEEIIRFIAKDATFKGIGESKARALWELLGEDFYKVVNTVSDRSKERLRAVLNDDSIRALFEGFSKYKNLAHCNWMSQLKIPSNVQQRLLRFHDDSSVEAIKSNPYLLIGFGMPFNHVDSLALKGDIAGEILLNDVRRLSSALEMAIRGQVEKGHTYVRQSDLRPALMKLLGDKTLVTQAFMAGHKKAQYILNPKTFTYHPTAQFLMENVVAKRLLTLAERNDLYDEEAELAFLSALKELPYALTEKQFDAVKTCLGSLVSCITGGAGTGKTTVLRTALRAFEEMGYSIHAVALSGRAAMRLHESIGLPTKTIAALLREGPIELSHTSSRLLLVIDEASMIDLPTMYRIVNHIHPAVRIIFSGDPDQLPPIGCGKVLDDVVHSYLIANTKLDIVKRQDGSTGIPEYSKLINEGTVPSNLSMGNVYFHETKRSEIARICCDLYGQSPEKSRVMAPTKALVSEVNSLIQHSVNSKAPQLEFDMLGERYFLDMRLNDAILFTQNQYDKGIQNGSLGTLTSISQNGDIYGEVTLDTGAKIEINQAVLDCMELGYAITLHKAQGSQFPRVIIALQKSRIVDRAWLYTAITRAEVEVHIVGQAEDMRRIIKARSNSNKRASYLKTLLSSR